MSTSQFPTQQPDDSERYGPRPPQNYGAHYAQQPPAPPKKGLRKLKWWHWLLIVLAFLFIVGQCSGPGVQENTETAQQQIEDEPEQTEPEPEVSETPAIIPEPEPTPEAPDPTLAQTDLKDERDQLYLELMRSEAPGLSAGQTDEDLHNIGRGICVLFDQGNSVMEIIGQFMTGDPTADGELGSAIGLAVPAKCPEYAAQMSADIERMQSR